MSVAPATALVTGGASGIGAACVRALREQGLQVGVIDLADGAEADAFVQVDVRDAAAVAAAVTEIEGLIGPIDCLVTTAGYYREGSITELSVADWQDMLAVHVGGTTAAFRAVLPGMTSRGHGAICAIGSELGLCGDPFAPHYAAAKGAIHALVKSVAPEVASANVRVNVIAPGPTDTPLLRDDPNFASYSSTLPLGRIIQPDEIAAAVCFVLLENTTLTGQVVSPNGGAVM